MAKGTLQYSPDQPGWQTQTWGLSGSQTPCAHTAHVCSHERPAQVKPCSSVWQAHTPERSQTPLGGPTVTPHAQVSLQSSP
jgi:hypothetical protein